jgi:CBS domain-containing protein
MKSQQTTKYVVDVMTPNPVVVSPATVAWSAEYLAQKRGVHHLLVLDGYRLVGVVCLCDLYLAGATALVGDCMRTFPITVDDQQTAETAARLMAEHRVGCLPVLDWCGSLRGVVTRRDLRKAGVLPQEPSRACVACGATHGLSGDGDRDEVTFCLRCLEQGRRPEGTTEEMYFTLGGSD